jgi:hypothetical protein
MQKKESKIPIPCKPKRQNTFHPYSTAKSISLFGLPTQFYFLSFAPSLPARSVSD